MNKFDFSSINYSVSKFYKTGDELVDNMIEFYFKAHSDCLCANSFDIIVFYFNSHLDSIIKQIGDSDNGQDN